MRRIQPWPWAVRYEQYSAQGKPSRPRIIDTTGKPVRLSRPKQAWLAASAPLLLDRLKRLHEKAYFLHLQLQSALGLNLAVPEVIALAEEAIRRAEWL
jgi:hypothetical protein